MVPSLPRRGIHDLSSLHVASQSPSRFSLLWPAAPMLLRRGAASSSSSMAFPAPSFYPSSNSASLKCTVVAALDGGAQRRFQHSLEVGDLAAASEPLAQGFGSGGPSDLRSLRLSQQFFGGLRRGDDASSSTGHCRRRRLGAWLAAPCVFPFHQWACDSSDYIDLNVDFEFLLSTG